MIATAGVQALEGRGPLARVDVRVKFAVLALASTLIFVWNSLWLQGALLGATVLLFLGALLPPARIARTALMLLPAFVLVLVIQGLWSPFGETPVAVLPPGVPLIGGRTVFFVEGLLFGLVVCCRILIPLLAFQYVFLTTEPNGIVLGLVRMGLPYRVAFLVSTTFRFVPLLLEEFGAMRDAQRLRGVDVDAMGPVRRLSAMGQMLVPLIVVSLGKSQQLEIALQAKGFSATGVRTSLDPGRERLDPSEWAAIAAMGATFLAAVAARLAAGVGAGVL